MPRPAGSPTGSAATDPGGPASRDLTFAVLLFTFSMLVLVCMDAVAKWVSARLDPLFITWARYASQFVILLMLFGPGFFRRMRTNHLRLQLLRSALMLGATLFFFSGLALMPLSAAIALIFVSPLFVVALAGPVLGEKVGPRRWAAVIIGLAGMLLIVRPGTEAFTWASLLILGAVFCYGGQQLATRYLSVGDPASTTLIFTAIVGAVVMSLAAPFVWQTPSWEDAAALVSLGLLASVGHFMLIQALTLAPASLLAPLDYTSLIWGTLLGMLVFNETLDPLTLTGAAIIAGSGLFVYLRERQLAKRVDRDHVVPPPVA